MILLLYNAVNSDTAVGADSGASGASDTLVGVLVGHEMIPSVIYFLGLELEHIARAGNNTKIASFASFPIDVDSSYDFCHIGDCS